MDGIIERAKKFVGQVKEFGSQVKKDVSGLATENPQSLKGVRQRQGEGFYQADIGISGEEGKSSEPAHGKFEHNSPAKPL